VYNPFDVGDPYIEWAEENASREPELAEELFIRENSSMEYVQVMETMKNDVVNLLVAQYDFTIEEAEETVGESASVAHQDMWNENANPADLAKFLASEDSDD